MGDYETVISIAAFLVVSHVILVMGGGGQMLFNLPEDTKPPELFPSPAEEEIVSADLKADAFQYENISFVDSSTLSDPDAAYSTDQVAVLEDGTENGFIEYNFAGIQYVEAWSTTNCGGFFGDSGLQIGSGRNTTGYDYICGLTKANVEESNVNFVRFRFDGSDYRTPRLYNFNWSESTQNLGTEDSVGGALGRIAGFFGALGELISYPVRLWDYFEHFPIYINLFYGALLAWMAVDIVQIG